MYALKFYNINCSKNTYSKKFDTSTTEVFTLTDELNQVFDFDNPVIIINIPSSLALHKTLRDMNYVEINSTQLGEGRLGYYYINRKILLNERQVQLYLELDVLETYLGEVNFYMKLARSTYIKDYDRNAIDNKLVVSNIQDITYDVFDNAPDELMLSAQYGGTDDPHMPPTYEVPHYIVNFVWKTT